MGKEVGSRHKDTCPYVSCPTSSDSEAVSLSRRWVPTVQCHNRMQNCSTQGGIQSSSLYQCIVSCKDMHRAPCCCFAGVNNRYTLEGGYWGCLDSYWMCSHTPLKRDIIQLVAKYDASWDLFWQLLGRSGLSFHPFHKWYKMSRIFPKWLHLL